MNISLRCLQRDREAAVEEPSCPQSAMLSPHTGKPCTSFQTHIVGCGNTNVPETRCVLMAVEQVMVFESFGVKLVLSTFSIFSHFFHLSGFEVKLSFVEDSLARYQLHSDHIH